MLAYMDTMLYIVLPTIFAAAIVFFAYARKLSSSHTLKRKKEMRFFAMKIRFDFSGDDELGVAKRIQSDKVFFYGKDGTAENIISGKKNGISVTVFDYSYTEMQKKSTTVCMLTIPSTVSTFEVFPLDDAEIASGKTAELGEKLLGEKYRLECKDREFVEQTFNDNLVDFLSRRRRTTVLANGNTMVFHREKLLGLRKCYSLLDFAFGFYSKMALGAENEKGETFDIKADMYTD